MFKDVLEAQKKNKNKKAAAPAKEDKQRKNVEKKVIRSRNIASIDVNKNKLFKNWMQIRDKTSLTSFYPSFYQ